MSENNKKVAISYFIIHFMVEFVCFSLITQFMSLELSFVLALLFDFFAFVPQIFGGVINKKNKRFDLGSLGVALMTLGVLLFDLSSDAKLIISIIFIGLGNSALHECGAISTVVNGEGKLFPSALFVAGGSFGLVIGKILGGFGIKKWILIFPLLIIELIVLITNKYWLKDDVTYPEYHITKEGISITTIILVAVFITFARSFIGYAIPISWNKTVWQTILLFFMMGFGKAFGGYLSDKIGVKRVSILTTILCIPFLIFGEEQMYVSILGVFLFSMTMSITYAMLLSIIKDNPGKAFGFTTIGLFLGLVPLFTLGYFPKDVNIILIVILSLLSMLGFLFTLRKGEKDE